MSESENSAERDRLEDASPDRGGAAAPRRDPITRSERHQTEIEQWRSRVLEHRVPRMHWTLLCLLFLVVLTTAVLLPMQDGVPIAGAIVLLIGSAATALGYAKLRGIDRGVVSYASLTPVVDVEILHGEIRIVAAATDTLLKTFANPNATVALKRLGVLGVMSAAQKVMTRGGVTPETARVAGYAAWPEVERIEMPVNPGDFQTFHLLRLDASAKRLLGTLSLGETPIAETLATMAGEIFPPARSLLAEIETNAPMTEPEESS